MPGRSISVSSGEGRYQVVLQGVLTGEGLALLLVGGEQPHIGAVVLSIPRRSLTGEGVSCDSWVLPVPAHRDVVIAQPIAELICCAAQQTTVVSAGIHIAEAKAWEIEILLENCHKVAQQFIAQFFP